MLQFSYTYLGGSRNGICIAVCVDTALTIRLLSFPGCQSAEGYDTPAAAIAFVTPDCHYRVSPESVEYSFDTQLPLCGRLVLILIRSCVHPRYRFSCCDSIYQCLLNVEFLCAIVIHQ